MEVFNSGGHQSWYWQSVPQGYASGIGLILPDAFGYYCSEVMGGSLGAHITSDGEVWDRDVIVRPHTNMAGAF